MVPLSWFRKRRRASTRAEIEQLIEVGCPGGSDLERLGWLVRWIFQRSRHSREVMIARAGRLGIRRDRAERLLSGDVAFGFRWDLIALLLWECGAQSAAVEVARDLFHKVPRLDLPQRPPARKPDAVVTQPRPDGSWSGQNCSVLLTDVVGFGSAARTDQDRKVIREVMYRMVRAAFADANISWDDCYREDRGDGILIVIPPRVVITKRVVHPLLNRIADELSRYDSQAAAGASFQLRVALDVGPVESDDEGVHGRVLIDVARLIDVPQFKKLIGKAPLGTCLGFVASKFVYDRFIVQHPGELDADNYQEISGLVKEHPITGWIRLFPDAGTAAERTN